MRPPGDGHFDYIDFSVDELGYNVATPEIPTHDASSPAAAVLLN
jgi:hypothetical protein